MTKVFDRLLRQFDSLVSKYSATAQCVPMKEQIWTPCFTSYIILTVQIEKPMSVYDFNPRSPKVHEKKSSWLWDRQ